MTVVDASAVIELLLRSAAGRSIESRLLRRGESLQAPALIDVEIAQVLRRYAAHGEATPEFGAAALRLVAAMPIDRYSHEPLLDRVWQLRNNLTAHDAVYVALAEGLRVPLVTCDSRLAKAVGIRTSVERFR
jgi:predicted nucleic acid-binding protein